MKSLASENWSPCAIVRRCFVDPAFKNFAKVAACEGKTYGQTDQRTDIGPQHILR